MSAPDASHSPPLEYIANMHQRIQALEGALRSSSAGVTAMEAHIQISHTEYDPYVGTYDSGTQLPKYEAPQTPDAERDT